MTLFEQCVEAAGDAGPIDIRVRTISGDSHARQITRAVLECIRDNTPSPRTVDEMVRVLGETPGAGVYVA